MEDPMTDPRDEALRACMNALDEAEEYFSKRGDVEHDGLPNIELWLEDVCAKALATARAALGKGTP
jgi:hypothetical protein